ncbi:hypothetical protein [Rhizobium sp. BK251]|uniref:hypothetical protein n=1 Tax=Rhizobium sp. BK251 TaxID=2512125 RepID=UPI00104962D0|nr:hypothetical protein [Rhizobium sp. BK251]TCL70507.1 hypothetical protein EV286_107381 [Rhizobium sp. BK251]
MEPFDPRPVFMPLGDCDEEMLVAVVEKGDDGLTAAFYLALSNPAVAGRYRAENEKNFMEKPVDATGSGDGVTIKF